MIYTPFATGSWKCMFGSTTRPAVRWSRTSPARSTQMFYLTHFWALLIYSGCCFVSRSCHYLIAHSARTFLIPGLIKTENQGAVLQSPVGRCTKLHSVVFPLGRALLCTSSFSDRRLLLLLSFFRGFNKFLNTSHLVSLAPLSVCVL